MQEYIQVFTTTDKKQDAEKISRVLVEKRLAACIQIIGPVVSTYRWKGNIEKVEEWLCFIKSKKSVYNELERTIKKIHPYQIPEIICVPVIRGSREYLAWLDEEVNP